MWIDLGACELVLVGQDLGSKTGRSGTYLSPQVVFFRVVFAVCLIGGGAEEEKRREEGRILQEDAKKNQG